MGILIKCIAMREKSDENWEVAFECLDKKHLNASVSRLYYSVFQSVLLFAREKRNYESKPGNSVHSDMARTVRKEGKHGEFYYRMFERLRSMREKADYKPETPREVDLQNIIDDSQKMRDYFLREAGG